MTGFKSPRRSAFWDWAQATLLAVNLGWTALCLGGYLAHTMVITSALTSALVLVYAVACLSTRLENPAGNDGVRVRGHPAGLLFIPFLLYAAGNVLWVTPVRWLGWFDWFGWFESIAVFWVVLNGIRARRVQRALLGGLMGLAVVEALLGCYQHYGHPDWMVLGRTQAAQYVGRASGSFGSPNSVAAFFLLLIPATGAMAVRRGASSVARVFFGWLTLVLVLGLGLTISRGAWIGLAAALTAWPLLAGRIGWRRRVAVTAAILAGVLLAGGAAYVGSTRVRERFTRLVQDAGERSRPILWRAAWKMFRSSPLNGTGAGSFNIGFERYRPEGFLNEPQWAHNDYINTLSDYGAVGFVLFFGAAVTTATCSARSARKASKDSRRPWEDGDGNRWRGDVLDEPLVRQGLGIGLLAFALQLFVDFHFKIPALAMTFATVSGILVSRVWRAPSRSISVAKRYACGGLVGVAAIMVATFVVPEFRGEALRQSARERIDRLAKNPVSPQEEYRRLELSDGELARALELAPGNAQGWADRAYVLAQRSRFEPDATAQLGIDAQAAADKAISLSSVCPEFWIRRGVALDMRGDWNKAGDAFNHAITLSPNSVLPWYHYAYHLSLHPTERALAESLVAFCLRLDPQNTDGLRLRQRLASGHPSP